MRIFGNQQQPTGGGRIFASERQAEEEKQRRQTESTRLMNNQEAEFGVQQSRVPEMRRRSASEIIRDNPISNAARETGLSLRALGRGDINVVDVAKEVPGNVVGGVDKVTEVVIPGINKFAKTTYGVVTEGIAYAISPKIRESYKGGNLDLLPTITKTTPKDIAKYTFAAGIEASILKSLPSVVGKSLKARAGIGAIDGVGFAISEGLAQDKTPEEIVKSMGTYGVAGATISILTPYLIPLLKSELQNVPKGVNGIFKGLYEEVVPPKRTLEVGSATPNPTRVPISTPNSRYEAYLRRQGYEPYVPDNQLPTIDVGDGPQRAPSNVPEIDVDTPLGTNRSTAEQTYSLTLRQQDIFVSETDRLVDEGFGVGQAQTRALAIARGTTNDFTEVVADARSPISNAVQGEPVTSAPARQQEDLVVADAASEAATGQVPPSTVERIEVEMPTETVEGPRLPVGDGERQYSRLAADLVEDMQTVQRTSPEQAEQMGFATYRQVNMQQQAQMAADLVQRDYSLALRVASGEATVPGLLDNAVVMALSRLARNTNDATLAIRVASLRSTRMGQELRALRRDSPLSDDPTEILAEVVLARKRRAGASSGKVLNSQREKNFEVKKQKTMTDAEKALRNAKLKISEAQKVINNILC